MISSIFRKTKPINYIAVIFLLLLSVFLNKGFSANTAFNSVTFLDVAINFGLLLVTILLVAFIVYKNKISTLNTYAVALYVLFLACFPVIFTDRTMILANLLAVLAMRRLLSLQTQRAVKAKLFDSFLFIGIACFLYSWVVLLIPVALAAILFFEHRDVRNWLVPFVSAGVLWVGYILYMLYIDKNCIALALPDDLSLEHFGITDLTSATFYIPFGYLFLVGLFAVMNFLGSFQSKSISLQKPYWLLMLILVATLAMLLFSHERSTVVIFSFFPLSVFISVFLEKLSKQYMKEIVIGLFLILGVVMLVL